LLVVLFGTPAGLPDGLRLGPPFTRFGFPFGILVLFGSILNNPL